MSGTTITLSADIHMGRSTGRWSESLGTFIEWEVSRDAIEQVVDHAIDSGSKLLVIPGDLFDNGTPPAEVVSSVIQQLSRFTATSGEVVIIPGNHELKKVHPGHADPTCILSGQHGVHVVTDPQLVTIQGVQIACVPWPRQEGMTTEEQSQQLSTTLSTLASQWDDAIPGFLAGHLMVSECGFSHDDDSAKEPTVSWDDLDQGPWDAAWLGHIHNPQQQGKSSYVGSPVRRNLSDTDNETSCVVISTNGSLTPEQSTRKPIVTRRVVKMDLTGLKAPEVAEKVSEQGFSGLDKVTLVVDAAEMTKVQLPILDDTVTITMDPCLGTVKAVQGAVDAGISDEDTQMDSLRKWLVTTTGQDNDRVDNIMDVAREVLL